MKNLIDTTNPMLWGVISLLLGILILYKVSSGKYKRRGAGGLQHFKTSCFAMVLIVFFLQWMFKWASIGLILLGIFLIINA